jgi:AcrR family transcriptional regulator
MTGHNGRVSPSSRPYGGVSAERRHADRRAKLIEAGLELLGDRGWSGATVRAVCAEAGLTERYFYESFADREALLVAVFDQVAAEAAAAVVEAVDRAPHDAEAKARAAIAAFVELLTDDPRRARAMLITSQASEPLRRRREQSIRAFAALVSEQARRFYGPAALAPDDAELTALALVGGIAELLVSWLDGGLDVPRQRLIDHCTGLLIAAAEVSSAPAP